MFLVGLTGGIATGKSTVSKYLQEKGCAIIDADLIAREVVQQGTKGYKKIREKFGEECFHPNGDLNRNKLGQIIFADAGKRRELNSITHPEIYKRMVWQIFQYFFMGKKFVILDIPLLFESGAMLPFLSYTIVVFCSKENQLNRLMKRNKLTEEEARQRIDAQMSVEEKRQRATCVLNNDDSRDNLRQQVKTLHSELNSSWTSWKINLFIFMALGSLSATGALCLKTLLQFV